MDGNTTGGPTIQADGLEGATAAALKNIMIDLEDIKEKQAGAMQQ